MKKFTLLPHIADIRLKAEASSIEELFRVSLEGMNHVLREDFCQRKSDFPASCQIRVSSRDTTTLLIDFLSEVLTLSYIQTSLFCRVEFTEFGSDSLLATLFGARVQGFGEDIKAVSYHEAEIRQNSQGNYETNVVFDI